MCGMSMFDVTLYLINAVETVDTLDPDSEQTREAHPEV